MEPNQNNSLGINPNGSIQPTPTQAPTPTSPASMPPNPTPTPTSPPMGGMITPTSFSQSQPKNSKKMPLLIGGIAGIVLLAGLAYYFLLYVPNTPNNVWSAGLTRSGKALSKITETAADKESLDKILKTQVEATIDGDLSGVKFNGSLDTKFDETDTNSDLKFKASAEGRDIDLGLKLLTNIPKDSKFPNIYFQFYGLKALGLDQSAPEIAAYENKWIAVESEYIEKNFPQAAELPETSTEQLSAKDIADLAQVVNEVNGQYLFTADKNKAVLEQKQFVAKEKVDGISAYHYVVGINATNAKSYCKEIVNKVMAQNAAKKIVGENESVDKVKEDGIKACDEIKETKETFDMWMDAKYKLIYKARFADKENKNSYLDIGQNYKGGDDINFFINFNDDESKTTVKFNMSTNIKTNISSGNLVVGSTNPDTPVSIKVNIKASPFDGSIDSSKPAGSVSIEELLNKLGLDPSTLNPADPTSPVQGAKTTKPSSQKNLDGLISAFQKLLP